MEENRREDMRSARVNYLEKVRSKGNIPLNDLVSHFILSRPTEKERNTQQSDKLSEKLMCLYALLSGEFCGHSSPHSTWKQVSDHHGCQYKGFSIALDDMFLVQDSTCSPSR
jgi:hypothetical protein